MNQHLHETRHAPRRAACALLLTCALATCVSIPRASARQPQTSTGDAAKKPVTKHTAHKASSSSAKPAAHKTTTASSGKHSARRKKSSRTRGQQKIDSERAQAIQAALIREHYLSGEPSGSWNQASEEAMRRYQSDHGWQTKEVPDSRALISLGLGPSKDHLLNPESAMTTGPAAPPAAHVTPAAHNADAEAHTGKSTTPADPRPAPPPEQDPPHPQ